MTYTTIQSGYSVKKPYSISSIASSYSSSSSVYSIKPSTFCCGSFSRGQRCMGCPS